MASPRERLETALFNIYCHDNSGHRNNNNKHAELAANKRNRTNRDNIIFTILKENPHVLTTTNMIGQTPLHYACSCYSAVTELSPHSSIPSSSISTTILLQMTRLCPVETLQMKEYIFDRIPLHIAIDRQVPLPVLRAMMMKCPESLLCVDEQGNTPLHLACSHYSPPDPELFLLLIDLCPAALKCCNYDDAKTPLHCALTRPVDSLPLPVAVIKRMVSLFPPALDMSCRHLEFNTPLQQAVASRGGRYGKSLSSYGAASSPFFGRVSTECLEYLVRASSPSSIATMTASFMTTGAITNSLHLACQNDVPDDIVRTMMNKCPVAVNRLSDVVITTTESTSQNSTPSPLSSFCERRKMRRCGKTVLHAACEGFRSDRLLRDLITRHPVACLLLNAEQESPLDTFRSRWPDIPVHNDTYLLQATRTVASVLMELVLTAPCSITAFTPTLKRHFQQTMNSIRPPQKVGAPHDGTPCQSLMELVCTYLDPTSLQQFLQNDELQELLVSDAANDDKEGPPCYHKLIRGQYIIRQIERTHHRDNDKTDWWDRELSILESVADNLDALTLRLRQHPVTCRNQRTIHAIS
jgi:hypothetical protein